MDINEYQNEARKTAIYPRQGHFEGLWYAVTKLNGEAGECAEIVGKLFRDSGSVISETARERLKKEIGDTLWYIAAAASELGFTLSEIASANNKKLEDRHKRGVLSGSGDNR